MVNEELREQLKQTIAIAEEELAKLEDMIELGKATNNRNAEAEAQAKATRANIDIWKAALGI